MDTSWIDLPTSHPKYIDGCMQFIEFAKQDLVLGKIRCPCKNCKVDKWFPINEVERHILFKGFYKSYKNWIFHGKGDMVQRMFESDGGSTSEGFPAQEDDEWIEEPVTYETDVEYDDSTIEEDATYKKLLEASEERLYEGYAFPQILDFPSSYYYNKKMIKELGLGWKRTKGMSGDVSDGDTNTLKRSVPAKVMRYFPLIPRLKRIYMSSETTEEMRWHDTERLGEHDKKILRHPSDALAWKAFYERHSDFALDSRSVRLGLASDGFNPYRLMNTSYITWPVMLIPFNLPPWLCIKPSSFILSTLIPEKTSPGIDIDVYLQPLVHELKLLWTGVEAFDAFGRENFNLRAALLWTINDFPAYSMLSGLSTKGYNACPVCIDFTPSDRFGSKICYCMYRKWLPADHPYRAQGSMFCEKFGTNEWGEAPSLPSGTDILREQEKVEYVYGNSKAPQKKRGRQRGHNDNNNNNDVQDENAYGNDKSRDSRDDRVALKHWRIKPHLWLETNHNGSEYMPPASYSMSTEEKERFLNVLQKLKVPDGYGSNLSSCVNMKQRKLINLKSHDNHVLMQDILPVALRASNATKVIDLLARLSSFFKKLCSTRIDLDDLDGLQDGIILTLCELEKEFLPSFFTIMVHLLIHLVEEVKLGGPVQYRWMYPIERYLSHLKSHVTNKAQPERSIAEGFLLEETIRFCLRYLQGVKTIFNIPKRMDDDIPNPNDYLFNSGGRVIGKEVHCIDVTTEDGKLRRALAGGLNYYGRKLKGFMINGYKFLSTDRDCRLLTQNSGIMVEADGEAYYGKVIDIYELNYYGDYKVVWFRCDWVDIYRGVRAYPNGGVCVNFSKLMHSGRLLQDDPFVFSSQAKQVFYIEDEIQKGWWHVVKNKPRDLFDLGDSLAVEEEGGAD
ncbi:uncharacterized protein [Spinacia oleracea]|uniref:Transposase-associated domain-containing protein n=1 Tax=Spinacia oleracea TaxID=3562 RepID=A0ABM3QQQ7_SPIOL|nr:uncharacterized protein LOC130461555 [Spinacia oleracea]